MDAMKSAVVRFVQSQPWAIKEQYLDLINAIIYAKYFASSAYREAQLEKFHAEYGSKQYSNGDAWVRDGVAVIPIVGVIGKRMNMVGDISTKGVSADVLRRDIERALNDPAIDAIVLDVDSPGGTVPGTKEASDLIYNSRGKKPIVAHANELMASAAYWIGSAAEKVFATETADVGSIGVYTRHYDFSAMNELEGVKATYIYAGKYKTMGHPDGPLGKDELAIIQADVDSIYTMFVDTVVRNRGISADKVMTDARSLLANDAKERGLIDGIMTLDGAIAFAASMAKERRDGERASSLGARADSLIKQYGR